MNDRKQRSFIIVIMLNTPKELPFRKSSFFVPVAIQLISNDFFLWFCRSQPANEQAGNYVIFLLYNRHIPLNKKLSENKNFSVVFSLP